MKRILTFFAAALAVLAVSQLPASATTTPLTGVNQVVGGGAHTCAVTSAGRVWCWGYNTNDELGGGSVDGFSARAVAVRSPDNPGLLTNATQVSAYYQGACAVLTTHELVCWGSNEYGQHGIGNTANQVPQPQYVLNTEGTGHMTGVRSVGTSSGNFVCAVLLNGQVRCWGENADGQTGDGTTSPTRPFPVAVRAVSGPGRLTGVRSIEMGQNHACAVLNSGQVRCWGDNQYGQLGDGTANDRHRPVIVRKVAGTGALSGILSLGLGDSHSCAVTSTHQARCWGDNTYGKLGNGNDHQRRRPTPVVNGAATGNLGGVRSITGGVGHTCARVTGGQVRCWGNDGNGQLGNGAGGSSKLPVTVLDTSGNFPENPVSQLTTGDSHSCARIGGAVNCWGNDGNGQLGDDSTSVGRPLPVTVVRG